MNSVKEVSRSLHMKDKDTQDRDALIERLLPLSPITLSILISIGAGKLHGYDILKDVRADLNKEFAPSTIYRAIRRLLQSGLIEEAIPDEVEHNIDDNLRYYRLTPVGLKVLSDEKVHLQRSIDAIDRSMGGLILQPA